VSIVVRTRGRFYQYPLQVAPGGRYLVDRRGTPFLIKGETAWLALVNLTEAEQERYLADRGATIEVTVGRSEAGSAAATAASTSTGAPRAAVTATTVCPSLAPAGSDASISSACWPGLTAIAPDHSPAEARRNAAAAVASTDAETRATRASEGNTRTVTCTRLPG
jgi:hypothetical protein